MRHSFVAEEARLARFLFAFNCWHFERRLRPKTFIDLMVGKFTIIIILTLNGKLHKDQQCYFIHLFILLLILL